MSIVPLNLSYLNYIDILFGRNGSLLFVIKLFFVNKMDSRLESILILFYNINLSLKLLFDVIYNEHFFIRHSFRFVLF